MLQSVFQQIHLLPDADELLTELVPGYPVANVLTCVGVIFVLFMEQITFIMARKPNSMLTSPEKGQIGHIHTMTENYSTRSSTDGDASPAFDVHDKLRHSPDGDAAVQVTNNLRTSFVGYHGLDRSDSQQATQSSKHREVSVISNVQEGELDLFTNVLNSDSLRDLITAYVMEISIAVHSIIIGVDLGMLGQGQLSTLISLIIALSFHQFIEGVGLGATIQNSQSSLGSAKVATFIGIFSSTMPLGVAIGIATAASPASDTQNAFKGVANALAAGSLMYIALTEMVGSYFNEPDLAERPALKVGMMFSFALGIGFMSIIAVWA
jgi:zinc transporter ZupT